ncbi:prepilin-type N-terminal cleavage/methylation domain-containing protein [Desemzia sp. RIT804]|uniref:competence type IV pilus major pilin ComGC n=1 Tax=Desemzia sp. RIT 804 TaxID=2810209 RepID=UPI00194E4BFA|nr:competence type IV pilus major pilin ComGC [Desemzia sp. RIT 804]MBM6613354.1 prepilin-type N-terminal cleavage/methylation domain-containing protein [Desemzia sp. RIT 804]
MKKVKTLSSKGFTLIEMVIVLFVISVIMLLVIPNLSKSKDSIDSTGNAAFATVVQTQLDLYLMTEDSSGLTDANTFSSLGAKKYLNNSQVEQASQNLKVTNGIVTLKKE